MRRVAVGLVMLALLCASQASGMGTARAATTLPIGLCLRQPTVATSGGTSALRCARPVSTLPKKTTFYLMISVTDPKGLQSYALDWEVQRWNPKVHRWATVRHQTGVAIKPDWQFVWLGQSGLAAGRYRVLISTDFEAKYVGAPQFYFARIFRVH